MPDQRTVNRSTVDTSDPVVAERPTYEADAADRDVAERDAAERDAAERDLPESDVNEPDVNETDASVSETAQERADMVGVAGPTADASADPDAPMASDAPRNPDTATDPMDADAARDAGRVPDRTPLTSAEETTSGTSAELAPGDVPAPPPTTLWAGEDGEAMRERWREVQSRFVDDPRGAAAAADDLIGEAVDSITQELAAQRRQLGEWRAGGDFDTERLRVAVTGYRDFLDRVLSI